MDTTSSLCRGCSYLDEIQQVLFWMHQQTSAQLMQRDRATAVWCQREEIQKARVNGGSNYDGRTDRQNCDSNIVRCITCSRTVIKWKKNQILQQILPKSEADHL